MVKWERWSSTNARLIFAVSAVVLLASCSGSGDETQSPASSGTESSSAATPATIPVLPKGSPATTPLDQIEEDQVSLRGGGGPDWMAAGFGSLWVRRDNAVLNRLTSSGKVTATIDAGIWQVPVCQGLGVSDQAVWGCATSGKLMRVDPRTNGIVAIVPIRKVNEQGRLPAYDGKIWVLTGDGDQLVPISEQGNKPGPPIALDAFCTDVADQVVGSALWVVCPYDGAALRVDLDAGEVTARVEGMTTPNAITADSDGVFACAADGVVKIAGDDPAVVGIQPIEGGVGCTLRLDDETVWVRSSNPTSDFLVGLDAETGEVTQRVTAHGDVNGGDVIPFEGSLWVASFETARVFRLAPPGS